MTHYNICNKTATGYFNKKSNWEKMRGPRVYKMREPRVYKLATVVWFAGRMW